MALHNSGGALVCCHSREYLKDQNGQLIFWHTHSLEDAWNSPTRKEIQSALEAGIQHSNCGACFDEENVGGTSRRQAHNNLQINYSDRDDTPILLDLKLGNVCNLSCRTCNPAVSSRWIRDWWEIFEKDNNERFNNYDEYVKGMFIPGKLSYSDDNEKFWSSLNSWVAHAQYIDIYGAEPMLIRRLFDILQYCIDQGYSKNQVLHFNTNCTIWNQKYIDILSQFKQVYFDLSIDGLNQHYDYIRNGETWDVVADNLKKYSDFKNQYPQHSVSICITVSIFNMYYLDEIFDYFNRQKWNIHFNLAHMPLHVNIKALPPGVREIIKNKLLRSTSTAFLSNIAPIISYMEEELQGNQNLNGRAYKHGAWNEFLRSVVELDQLRNQDFKSTFPEFAKLLELDFCNIKS
jgi:MoaA/NifB/PqqE/SkfB family radical SAM enzyme